VVAVEALEVVDALDDLELEPQPAAAAAATATQQIAPVTCLILRCKTPPPGHPTTSYGCAMASHGCAVSQRPRPQGRDRAPETGGPRPSARDREGPRTSGSATGRVRDREGPRPGGPATGRLRDREGPRPRGSANFRIRELQGARTSEQTGTARRWDGQLFAHSAKLRHAHPGPCDFAHFFAFHEKGRRPRSASRRGAHGRTAPSPCG
jgi:hypothetical protein